MKEEFTFRGQRDDEDVLLIIKQNPWVMSKAGFIDLILAIVIVLSLVIFGASRISSWIIIISLLTGVVVSFFHWFKWWSGMYILTNQRIINIDQKSLFHRLISEAELDRIQDITTEVSGPIQTALNFGTIHIQTASSQTKINLTNVTDPYEVQQQIVKAHKLSKTDLLGDVEFSDGFSGKPVIR